LAYDEWPDKAEVAREVVREDDQQVGEQQTEQTHKDLHEGDVEVAHHVQFGEGVLGSDSHSADGAAGPAEGVPVHDGAQVGVLAQAIAEQLVAAAEEVVALQGTLLAAVQHRVDEVREEGKDCAEDYCSEMAEGQSQARQQVLDEATVGLVLVLVGVVVPVERNGLEEEVGVGLQNPMGPQCLKDNEVYQRVFADCLISLLLHDGVPDELYVGEVDGHGEGGEEDGHAEDVAVVPEAHLGQLERGHDELDSLLFGDYDD